MPKDAKIKITAENKTQKAFNAVTGGLNKLRSSANAVFSQFGRAGAVAVGGISAAALKMGGDFESSMNRVQALTDASIEEFSSLESQAKKLGATTQFSASQAADAMGFLAQAGFKTNEVVDAMPGTLKLAAAANLDLADSADIVSNVLSGYGLEVSELTRVNDVLVKAFTSTNTNLQQLGEAMKFAGPVAAAAGADFEEVTAALGLMGNAGIQAGMAGTSLRGAMTRILNPTKQVREAMEETGLSFVDSNNKIESLTDIITKLEPHAENAGLFMKIFGQRAGPAMAALVSQGAGALSTLTGQLKDSGGTAEKISAVQMRGLNGAVKALKSAFEALMITIGQSGFISIVQENILIVTRWMQTQSESTVLIEKLKAGFDGLTAVIGVSSTAVKGIVRGFVAVGTAIADAAIWVDKLLIKLEKIGEFGSEAVEKFKKGFTDKWESTKETVANLIPEGLRSYLEQNSPADQGVLDTGKWGRDAVGLFAEGMENDLPKLKKASESIGISMEDTIGGAIINVSKGLGGLRDFGISVLNDIARSMANKATRSIISVGGNILGGIFGRETGGPVFSGTPVLVGEKGPEIFTPSSNGNITRNSEIGGGGLTVNQHFNVQTGVAQTVRAEMMNMLPLFVEKAKQAVAEARQRDPKFSAQMGV